MQRIRAARSERHLSGYATTFRKNSRLEQRVIALVLRPLKTRASLEVSRILPEKRAETSTPETNLVISWVVLIFAGRCLVRFPLHSNGDTLSYSIGSTLVQSAGPVWNASLRYMEINREGSSKSRHTLTSIRQQLYDLKISHQRLTKYGCLHAGLGYSRLEDQANGISKSDVSGFILWSSN